MAEVAVNDAFRRTREFCPAWAEAGFRAGHLGVRQSTTAEGLGR